MSGADLEPALSSLAVSQSGPCLAFLFWGCPGQRFIWHLTTLWVRTGCRGQFSLCWFHSKSILVDPRVGHLPDLQLPLFLLKHVFGLAFAHVWVSRSCRNKLLQARLKNTDIYFLTIPEVRSLKSVITGLKSGCQQGHTPPEARGENLPLAPSSLTCGHIRPRPHCLLFFWLCQISLCISLTRTLVISFRAHQDNLG